MTTPSDALTAAQVANRLGVGVKTVHRMARDGRLPASKLPGQTGPYLFQPDDVQAYETAEKVPS